jgi:hypothetical protein
LLEIFQFKPHSVRNLGAVADDDYAHSATHQKRAAGVQAGGVRRRASRVACSKTIKSDAAAGESPPRPGPGAVGSKPSTNRVPR